MPKRSKGPTLEENTRLKIAEYLPDAIDHAMQSYRMFYATEGEPQTKETDKTKKFLAHHGACKVAIAHIELLLKLAAWAQLPRESEDADLMQLMAEAKAELDQYKEEEDKII